jgi:hypothetical protein
MDAGEVTAVRWAEFRPSRIESIGREKGLYLPFCGILYLELLFCLFVCHLVRRVC